MEQQLKPGPIVMLAGGVVMIIASFLDWSEEFFFGGGSAGLSTDRFGLLGIFTLVIGIATAVNGGLEAFAPQVKRPDGALSMSRDQIAVALGFAAFFWSFGLLFAEATKIGLILAAIGAAAVAVGGVLTDTQATPRTGPDQPTQF